MNRCHAIFCKFKWLFYAGLVFFVSLLYFLPAWHYPFIVFDDASYITQNPYLKGGLSWDNISYFWAHFYKANYHPITWLSHLSDVSFFGLDPSGHRMVSMIIHGLNSSLVFLFILLLLNRGELFQSSFSNRLLALILALIFACHPQRVESVIWISERKDVLAMFFGLLSILSYLHARFWKDKKAFVVSHIFFGCSLLSKPLFVTLPFILILLDPFFLKNNDQHTVKFRVWNKLGYLVLTVVSCILTLLAQSSGGAIRDLQEFSWGTRILNAVLGYIFYLEKFFLPTDLSIFVVSPTDVSSLWSSFCFALLISTVVFALLRFLKGSLWASGWLWFIGSLIPMIGLVQVGFQLSADRYSYLPHIGLLIIFVAIYESIRKFKPVIFILLLGLLGQNALMGQAYLGHWENSVKLYKQAAATQEPHYVIHHNLAKAYLDKGNKLKAIQHYSEATVLNQNNAGAYYSLGVLEYERGNKKRALNHFIAAISKDPNLEAAYFAIGRYYQTEKLMKDALIWFKKTCELNPRHFEAQLRLGSILLAGGQAGLALKHLEKAVELRPEVFKSQLQLGLALFKLNQFEKSYEALKKANALKVNDPNGTFFMGVVAKQIGKISVYQDCLGKLESLNSKLFNKLKVLKV